MAKYVEESQILAGCALAGTRNSPGSAVALSWLCVVVQSLIELLVVVEPPLDRQGSELADLGRVQRNALVESISEAVIGSLLVVASSSWSVHSQPNHSHREDSVSLCSLVNLHDGCCKPLVGVVLRVDGLVSFESLLPLPDCLGLTFEGSQLDRPSVEDTVRGRRLHQVLQREGVALDLGDLGLRPASTPAPASSVAVVEQGVDMVAFFEIGSPGLACTFGEKTLELLFWNLVVPAVEHTVVVEDLPAGEQEFGVEVFALEGGDQQIEEGLKEGTAGGKILWKKKFG